MRWSLAAVVVVLVATAGCSSSSSHGPAPASRHAHFSVSVHAATRTVSTARVPLDQPTGTFVAHEVTDRCNGHPDQRGIYHYLSISVCLLHTAGHGPTLVGYAFDGYGIYVERDQHGALLTDQDLDACHGRTSRVPWDGAERTIYHYDATTEYPYTIGCFHGTPAS